MRKFRFSVQANVAPPGLDWPSFARRIEALVDPPNRRVSDDVALLAVRARA